MGTGMRHLLARGVALAAAVVISGCGAAITPQRTATASITAAPTQMPTATATPAPTRTPLPAWTPGPEPTIGEPADDGARIIAVDPVTMLQHKVWLLPGTPGCPADSNPGCWLPVGTPIPTTRVVDLTIESPAGLQTDPCSPGPIGPVRTAKVRLVLPEHFAEQPSIRWPVLYLHHGGCLDHTHWSEDLDVMTLTGPTDLLVVMPDGDAANRPGWITFHLVELRQLLERNWQAGDKRAVAGMSFGGAEAMQEAERVPGMFLFAGAYSGALDQFDVLYNAEALKGTALYFAYGNGQLGPLDNGQVSSFDPTGGAERACAASSAALVARLSALNIPVTVYAYGNGTHDPKYWQRDFERSFPLILAALGETP
jgi:diacylglycerol O-acyltransferase/trehalose O-mycolyltransferase